MENKCIQCGKRTNNSSFCSNECVDIYDGEAPRRSGNPNFFYVDSPHKKEDPGHTNYMSNEERRVYRKI